MANRKRVQEVDRNTPVQPSTRERVLDYVRERLQAGVPPTVREVQHALEFKSVNTAREHIDRLIAEGKLLRDPGLSRGLRLPMHDARSQHVRPSQPHVQRIPVVGRVQAGALTHAEEDLEGHVMLETRYAEQDLFALRVQGESMIDAGIMPDDLVVVRRQPRAESGQIVVAMVDGEATVKTLKLGSGGRVELHPANDRFSVIIPEAGALAILGRVIRVHRMLD